jgi:hypothetical protein
MMPNTTKMERLENRKAKMDVMMGSEIVVAQAVYRRLDMKVSKSVHGILSLFTLSDPGRSIIRDWNEEA